MTPETLEALGHEAKVLIAKLGYAGAYEEMRVRAGEKPIEERIAESRRLLAYDTTERQTEVRVKTYSNAKEYEHDAPKMAAQGWQPQGQSQGGGHLNMGRTAGKAVVFLPRALIRTSRTKDKITVTWVR